MPVKIADELRTGQAPLARIRGERRWRGAREGSFLDTGQDQVIGDIHEALQAQATDTTDLRNRGLMPRPIFTLIY